MKIFIYTSDFLAKEVKSIIEICEYTFQYGSLENKKPPILVRDYGSQIHDVIPKKEPFIFFFIDRSRESVQSGIQALVSTHAKNPRKKIFAIATTAINSDPRLPEFDYKSLALDFESQKIVKETDIFWIEDLHLEFKISIALRNVISEFDL